jgi:hypothetical protein
MWQSEQFPSPKKSCLPWSALPVAAAEAANVGDDLPDFFVGHPHSLTVGPVCRHRGAGNTVADDLEHVSVRMSVSLLCASQIRAASAAPRSQPMTQRAIDTELIFAGLRRFRIPGQWVLRIRDGTAQKCRHNDSPSIDHAFPFGNCTHSTPTRWVHGFGNLGGIGPHHDSEPKTRSPGRMRPGALWTT